jgi:hypothetical protein
MTSVAASPKVSGLNARSGQHLGTMKSRDLDDHSPTFLSGRRLTAALLGRRIPSRPRSP